MHWLKVLLRDERWLRWVVMGTIYVCSLAFFLHYREVRVDVLELNATAEKYVLAQIGFEFPDVEATSLLKSESMRDIGRIFRIDDKELTHRISRWQENLVDDPSWRAVDPTATFERMYQGGESIRDRLLKSRFVDERTFRKMEELKLSTDGYVIFTPQTLVSLLPSPLISEELAPPSTIQHFREQTWSLQEDLSAQNAVKQAVKSGIRLKKTRVEPGSRIINAGEKVTPRHIDMMKAMKREIDAQNNPLAPLTILGNLVMASIFALLSSIYLHIHHHSIFKSFRRMALLGTIVILTLAIAKISDYCFTHKLGSWIDVFRYPVFVPFGTLLLTLLVGSEVALVTSGFMALVLGITLSVEYDYFLVVNLLTALVAIAAARTIRRRKDILSTCAKMWVSTIPVILAFNLAEGGVWNFHIVTDFLTTFLFITATGVGVLGLLPILESAFGVASDMTLAEYMDPSHPLLRRLSTEAPGTYQHSLVVATVSEAAAQAIGANGLFCRVSSLYHDIGKLANPHYFTENQLSGFNIHQLLTPQESAQVIIAHVREGVALAEKYDLPPAFIEIIREHHGTTSAYFFYHAQVELMGGDCSQVDLVKFRYSGPKPHSKESAIIMIADCMEAAFRCIEEVCEKDIASMVDCIVKEKIDEGQFDECNLTFEELGEIKKAVVRTLLVTRHTRVKYPVKRDAVVSRIEGVVAPRI